jgi:hypothetical protein
MRDLERKAWKSYHQDGLKDIFLGLILLAMGISGILGSDLALIGFELVAILVLLACKKYVTTPRMGHVEFSPERKARKMKAVLLVGASALVGLGAYLALAGIGGASEWLAGHRELVHAGVGLWIFLLLSMMAYWLDFTRLYWIALVICAAFIVALWLGNPLVFVVAGTVVLAPGMVLLIRFLHQYPIPRGTDPTSGNSA